MLLEREQTRSRLEAALQGARAGNGRIVSLEGEAGIGKTSAALDFVGAHRADAQVYVGRGAAAFTAGSQDRRADSEGHKRSG